ncbi:hypothetical protein HW555_000558, partial [Spodoptera exigua]
MGRSQELLNAAREGDKRTVEKILGQITNISGPFTSFKNILQVGKPRGVELPVPVTEQVSKLEKPEEPIWFVNKRNQTKVINIKNETCIR